MAHFYKRNTHIPKFYLKRVVKKQEQDSSNCNKQISISFSTPGPIIFCCHQKLIQRTCVFDKLL